MIMKRLPLLLICWLIAIAAHAQDNNAQKNDRVLKLDGPVDNGQRSPKDGAGYTVTKRNDTVYYAVEYEPLYPGGLNSFNNFVNAHFDQSLLNNTGPSREIITFIVKKDGSLTDVKVIRGITAAIDSETVRVVRTSPKWHPGSSNGKLYNVQFTVAIRLNSPVEFTASPYKRNTDTLTTMSKPHFKGGKAAYYKFLAENLQWPDIKRDVHGAIHLAFIVEEDGSLKDIHVIKGLTPKLDEEALRVIRLSTPWV